MGARHQLEKATWPVENLRASEGAPGRGEKAQVLKGKRRAGYPARLSLLRFVFEVVRDRCYASLQVLRKPLNGKVHITTARRC